jgi:hypothetical protein
MRRWIIGWVAVSFSVFSVGAVFSADPPPQKLWRGRLDDKAKAAGIAKAKPAGNPQSPADAKSETAQKNPSASQKSREPEWLQRMDKNERATLTGGWGLQNFSGGAQSLTTAGDQSGTYAPNTYQGGQFQAWNNLSNRDNLPNWNSPTPGFPTEMWSQGYMSPNSYFGADAQVWGNMSAGSMSPNSLTGGWSMSP